MRARDSANLRDLIVAGLLVVAVVLYAMRRPDQFAAPMVWDEERDILVRLYGSDPWSVLQPIAGEYLTSSSVLVSVAAKVSFFHLPEIELALMILVFLVTLLLLIIPRSTYGSRYVLGMMGLYFALVPINPETYGVLLYSFWWLSVWPVIVLGWRRDILWLRIPILVVAGASSLAATLALPLFLVRYFMRRQTRDLWSAAALFPLLMLQLHAVMKSGRTTGGDGVFPIALQVARTPVFFLRGFLDTADVIPNNVWVVLLAAGTMVLLFLAAVTLRLQVQRQTGLILILVIIGYTSLSAIPFPLWTNPSTAGPRYYFLPFAYLGIFLIYICCASPRWSVRAACLVVLIVSLLPLQNDFARGGDEISWKDAVVACRQSTHATAPMPVQWTGYRETVVYFEISTAACG